MCSVGRDDSNTVSDDLRLYVSVRLRLVRKRKEACLLPFVTLLPGRLRKGDGEGSDDEVLLRGRQRRQALRLFVVALKRYLPPQPIAST